MALKRILKIAIPPPGDFSRFADQLFELTRYVLMYGGGASRMDTQSRDHSFLSLFDSNTKSEAGEPAHQLWLHGAGPRSCYRGAIYSQEAGRGTWARGGARNPLQTSSSHLSPGERCGATAQSALGWYRPSVGVPETLDGKPSNVLV